MASAVRKALSSAFSEDVNIAVIGECGSGRSSFINAIRDLDDEDENAAMTGVLDVTEKPIPYPFPTHPNVTTWELPSIGSPTFQAGSFLQQVNFSCYDIFIIITSQQFRFNHICLAREIQRMGKKYYFVRSKVDVDLYSAARRRPSSYNEERILQEIREYCCKCLRAEGLRNPRVFLISTQYLGRYDFHLLQETLVEELSSDKNHSLVLALPNYSDQIIQKKKEALKEGIWRVAAASCAGALVPIPGVSAACNVVVLEKYLRIYSKNFGLDRDSFTRLSKQSHKPREELERAIIKTRVAEEITQSFVIALLATFALAIASSALVWVPVIGAVICAGISYKASYAALQSFLEDAAEDAKNVRKTAWERGILTIEGKDSSKKVN